MTRFANVALLIASATLILGGCKNEQSAGDNSIQSLDNFAAGSTVRVNQCTGNARSLGDSVKLDWEDAWDAKINLGPDLRGKLSADKVSTYKDAVKSYLSALPIHVQRAFYHSGGTILLSSRAKARCTQGLSDLQDAKFPEDQRRKIESCYLYTGAGNGSELEGKAAYAVYHHVTVADSERENDENLKRIRHGGVRVFGLIMGQFYSKLSINDNEEQVAAGLKFKQNEFDTVKMAAIKTNLANAFIRDVYNTKSNKYSLETLEYALGEGSAAKIRSRVKAEGLEGDLLAEATFTFAEDAGPASGNNLRVRRTAFEDFVLAEAFDSFNCNKTAEEYDLNTLAVMRKEFNESYNTFLEVNSAIIQMAKLIADEMDDGATRAQTVEEASKTALAEHANSAMGLTTTFDWSFITQLFPMAQNWMSQTGARAQFASGSQGGCASGNCPTPGQAQVDGAGLTNSFVASAGGGGCASCGCSGPGCTCPHCNAMGKA